MILLNTTEPEIRLRKENTLFKTERERKNTTIMSDNNNNNNDFWTAWQLLDPLLPTGGFAHSNGLEAATQFGFIDSGNGYGIDVSTFVSDIARNACSTLAPFVLASRNRFDTSSSEGGEENGDIATWSKENAVLHAMLIGNAPALRASLSTGTALCRAAVAAFSGDSSNISKKLKALKQASKPNSCVGHLACVFGAVCGILGVSEKITIRMFVYVTVRDACSAATRLNVVGPLEVAAILRKSTKTMEDLCKEAIERGSDIHSAAVSAPLAEMFATAHDQLHGRLFNS